MDEQKRLETIQELERQIAGLPIGYISKKNINGKTRYYHQWTENGKKRSKYLRDGEMEPLQEQIEQRKSLQAELKKLQAGMPKQRQPKLDFETSVIIGRGLTAMSQGVENWGRRDCFAQLEDYLYSPERDRVCLPVQPGARPGLPDLRPAPDRKNHHAPPGYRADEQRRLRTGRLSQGPQNRYHGYGESGSEETI